MKDLDWIVGAPDALEPGMLVRIGDELFLIGHVDAAGKSSLDSINARRPLGDAEKACISAWAWLIKPHELAWASSMARAHGVA